VPLLAGLLVMAVPTVFTLGKQTWATEAGAHGPIILATGFWLLYHDGLRLANAGRGIGWAKLLPLLAPAFALYIFGRAYDFISLEVAGLYLVLIGFLIRLYGPAQIRLVAFPIFYLGFAVPPPGWLIDRMTAPLQMFVSLAAEHLTRFLGYPVARQGVSLVVAQYQLLVEDACAGMNSLMGLTAVSLFYIYMVRRASWRYALLLVALIIPIAVIVNIIRVLALILITYHLGNEAAQGFLHATTGMVLFGMALIIIFGIDMVLWRLFHRGKAA
jgi:exosortase